MERHHVRSRYYKLPNLVGEPITVEIDDDERIVGTEMDSRGYNLIVWTAKKAEEPNHHD